MHYSHNEQDKESYENNLKIKFVCREKRSIYEETGNVKSNFSQTYAHNSIKIDVWHETQMKIIEKRVEISKTEIENKNKKLKRFYL